MCLKHTSREDIDSSVAYGILSYEVMVHSRMMLYRHSMWMYEYCAYTKGLMAFLPPFLQLVTPLLNTGVAEDPGGKEVMLSCMTGEH